MPQRQWESQTNWGPARCLMAATAVAGLAGIPLGLHLATWSVTGRMGEVPWVGLAQAHGQAQLFGWLGLAVLGVTFHAMAHLFRAAEPPARLAALVLGLQLAGVALRLAAPLVPGAAAAPGAWLLVASALAFLGAFLVTLEAHVRTLPRRSKESRGPAVLPRYLMVGLLLWLAALLVNVDAAISAVRFGPAAAGAIAAGHNTFIITAVGYGLALIAAGMSLRVVVGWLDLPRPDLTRASQAWWLLAAGAVLRATAAAFDGGAWASPAGGLAGALWAAGVFWYLPALRGLWSPSAVRPGGGARGEGDPPLAWFVRAAYAWFAVTGVLALAESLVALIRLAGLDTAGFNTAGWSGAAIADAGRHALLFGYLVLLTAGLSGRLPTAFLDVGDTAIDATRGRYGAAWALLVTASVLRMLGPLAGELRGAAMIASGLLGMVGLSCLLLVLWQVGIMAYRRDRLLAARTRGAGGHASPLPGPA